MENNRIIAQLYDDYTDDDRIFAAKAISLEGLTITASTGKRILAECNDKDVDLVIKNLMATGYFRFVEKEVFRKLTLGG